MYMWMQAKFNSGKCYLIGLENYFTSLHFSKADLMHDNLPSFHWTLPLHGLRGSVG